MIKYKIATLQDVPILAVMNQQLTADEQHRNQFRPLEWFQKRMTAFLSSEYSAVIFENEEKPVAYALYKNHDEHKDTIYLRQVFVDRSLRRQGIARQAIRILINEVWPKDKRITVESLSKNEIAISFYKSVGFTEYSIEFEFKPGVKIT